MLRPWLLGASLVLIISTGSLASPVRLRNAAELDAVYQVAVGLAAPHAALHPALPVRSAQPAAVQVMEPSRRSTLEQLRRSLHLYPDHDLVSRFLEDAAGQRALLGDA